MLTVSLNYLALFRRRTLLLVCTFGLLLSSVRGDEPLKVGDPEVRPEDALRKARVEFLAAAVKHFEVQVGEEAVESKRHPEPVLVYNNPVSGTKLGVLGLFTRNGRPDVMAQFSFSGPQSVFNEFHNLCGDQVVLKRGAQTIWTPPETSTKWQTLETSEKPATTPQLRLVQMRRLAEKFTVEDSFGWDKKELNQLRLLTTPVYRYGNADQETIDGAVFVYALGTDPEAVLMLECAKGESGLFWRYGFGPMSIYALKAKLGETVVWEIPERKVFGHPKSVQYVSPYQLAPGEKYPE